MKPDPPRIQLFAGRVVLVSHPTDRDACESVAATIAENNPGLSLTRRQGNDRASHMLGGNWACELVRKP